MLFKKGLSHLLVIILWLFAISFLRLNFRGDLIGQLLGLFPLWLGGILGAVFPDFDQITYCFITFPGEFSSLRVKRLIEQKKIKDALSLVIETSGERTKLTVHNVLFQIVLIVLCIFVVTSTSNMFGKGLVMAIFLHLLNEEVDLIRQGKTEDLKKLFFWPLKKDIALDFQKNFVYISSVIFAVLSLFLIR